MTIGKRLEETRKNKNVSRKEISEKINIDLSSLSKIENDKQIPSAKIIADICYEFGFDANYILTGLKSDYITQNEKEIIENFRKLEPNYQKSITDMINTWKPKSESYIKSGNL